MTFREIQKRRRRGKTRRQRKAVRAAMRENWARHCSHLMGFDLSFSRRVAQGMTWAQLWFSGFA